MPISDCYGQEFPHSELSREESQQETQDRKPRQPETETDPPTVPEASPNTVLPVQLKLKFRAKYPHTPSAYCQGLYYEYDTVGKRGILYESTGRYGRSQLRCTDLKTGKSLSEINLAADFFGEGLAVVNNRIYQLTWQERTCFVYDKQTFRLLDEFRYPGEGWGLAWDGSSLIMSDGSDTLRFLDPQNFRRQKTLRVTYKEKGRRKPLKMLNELEYIEGEIWANIYQTTKIARIDPKTGDVIQFLDFAALVPGEYKNSVDYVLNGIAYDAENHRIFLTGKCWPLLYEIGWE